MGTKSENEISFISDTEIPKETTSIFESETETSTIKESKTENKTLKTIIITIVSETDIPVEITTELEMKILNILNQNSTTIHSEAVQNKITNDSKIEFKIPNEIKTAIDETDLRKETSSIFESETEIPLEPSKTIIITIESETKIPIEITTELEMKILNLLNKNSTTIYSETTKSTEAVPSVESVSMKDSTSKE